MNDTIPKVTVSKELLEQLGLTDVDLKRLNGGWYSRLVLRKPLAPLGLLATDATAVPVVHSTITCSVDGALELAGITVAVHEERVPPSIPANQQFILDYAALCEQTGLHICARDDDRWLGPAAVGESDSIVQLTAGVSGTWCPELKALFLKHAAVPFYPDSPGTLNIAENVSLEEWMEASGCEHVRDHYIASDVRNFVRNSRPGTHFSNQLTRWYLHAVENDC